MIEKLRIRNDLILSKCVNKSDSTYIKQVIIKRVLTDEQCFFKMPFDDAFNILRDLGYKENDAINIYKVLLNPNEYNKLKDKINFEF